MLDLEEPLSPRHARARPGSGDPAIAAGPLTNLVFAVILFAIVFMVAGWNATNKVSLVLKGSQAQAAGLVVGDEVVGVNGLPVTADQISDMISASHGRPVELTVLRRGT